MKLKIINTGSKGNCYILYNQKEALILDCGVKFHEIKKALNFDLGLAVGCLLTHEHLDHSIATKDLIYNGIDVFSSFGTFEALKIKPKQGCVLRHKEIKQIGNFKIIPFNVTHDVKEPLGFYINHSDCGNVLFVTDTSKIDYNFPDLNNIIIEANYCEEILLKNSENLEKIFLSKRIVKNHLSIQNCIKYLKSIDTKEVNNIVLIHLSDRNSNEKDFDKKMIDNGFCINVTIADKNMDLHFDKSPF